MIITEYLRTRVAMPLKATGTGSDGFLAPTPGAKHITVRAVVTMGNAADLTISLQYADDAEGTNATAFGYNVPIYVNGVRDDDGKSYKIEDSSGNFIVDFVVDPGLIPEGKYIGASYGNSHASNLMCLLVIEDVAYKPTAS